MSANKKNVQIGLGISSILMIFVVLCMSVLSVLTYRDATQKMKITLRQQTYQQQYMDADARMEFVLVEIEKSTFHSVEQIAADGFLKQLCEELKIVMEVEANACVLTTSLYNEQRLSVKFHIEGSKLSITSYQVIT